MAIYYDDDFFLGEHKKASHFVVLRDIFQIYGLVGDEYDRGGEG